MWTCPKCKHKFYNKNQWHSCGNYSIKKFLNDKSGEAIALFYYFISEYKKIGELEIHPVKTRVALHTQMRFCSINKIGVDYINVHLVLTKAYEDNVCFHKIENLADKYFIHHFTLHDKKELTRELKKYMKLAYKVGTREYIKNNRWSKRISI
jgi:hypothetical protein